MEFALSRYVAAFKILVSVAAIPALKNRVSERLEKAVYSHWSFPKQQPKIVGYCLKNLN
jgi:hypothetical protein